MAKKDSKNSKAPKKQTRAANSPEWQHILWGIFCGLLAVFCVMGWFLEDAKVLNLLTKLLWGLFGIGVYLVPLVLGFLCFFLLFKDISALIRRVIFISLLPLEFGALVFLFRYPENLWTEESVAGLWIHAIEDKVPGGFFSGCLGAGLRWCLSNVGAAIVLILLLVGAVFAVFGIKPVQLIMDVRKAMPGPEEQETKEERLARRAAERKYARQQAKETHRQLTMEDLASRYAGGTESPRQEEDMKMRVKKSKEPILVEELPPDEFWEEKTPIEEELFFKKTPEPSLDEDIHTLNTKKPYFAPDSDFIQEGEKSGAKSKGISEDFELVTDKIRRKQNLVRAEENSFEQDLESVKREMQEFDKDSYISESGENFSASFDSWDGMEEGKEKSAESSLDMDPSYPPVTPPQEETPFEEEAFPEESVYEEEPEQEEKPKDKKPAEKKPAAVEKSAPQAAPAEEAPSYVFPPVDLLRSAASKGAGNGRGVDENREHLVETLNSFGVEPNIVAVVKGPTVTRYELKLSPGVKLSKITGLADDIALALGASGVRIAAIPEKISVVGIEVPNKTVDIVTLREVIDSEEFEKSKSKISFAVGKDIGGNRIMGNIAKLPHLLIAGTTGSGKSVCMNCLITSLLYKALPDEVKLIMIDPKMVELGVYNGIPHLMLPVITDPKKASGSLQWAVSEMLRRYSLMAESGTRDLESYNRLVEGNPERKKIPQLVVIIDELADLMMAAAKEVEESICRVAQMGRAAGVHLVIATQRPSANVITGLMKANIPSRIAFAVSSAMESRIILDAAGAEKLVGRGDMLFAPLGEGKAKRIQGCYVSDEEVLKVVTFVKASSIVCYDKDIEKDIEEKAKNSGKQAGNAFAREMEESGSDGERDELLFDAVDVFMEIGQASVSVLQRRLKTGYARSARIVDQMEEMGIVGPSKGSKPRDILISKEKWQEVKDGLVELEEALAES